MGVDIEDTWHPSIKLNAIGQTIDRGAGDPIPEDVTRDEIEEICFTIEQLYGEYVEELVAETDLSRREAQTWALRNLVYEGAEPLSYEAIGLYIWAIGRAREGDPLSRTIVTEYYERAVEKIERAEATVMRTGPPPYPDELFDDPTVLWVESTVGDRLRGRLAPEENFSELLDRLLEETSPAITLAELVDAYEAAKGTTYVAVDTVYQDWDQPVRLVVHTPESGPLPDRVANDGSVLIGETTYDVSIQEQSEVQQASSHLPVFHPPAEVDLATGIDRLTSALDAVECTPPELVSLLEDRGGVGLAVDETPTGAGAHLYPIYEAAREDRATDLDYVARLTLDDRTLQVSQVSPVTVTDIRARTDEVVFLWVDGTVDGLEPKSLPSDPVDRREQFPNVVLWTA